MRFTDYLVNVLVDSLLDVDITAFYFIYMVFYVGECPALLHDFVLLPPVINASRSTLLDDKLNWKKFQSHSPAMGPPSLLNFAGHCLFFK
jgi:hypothetical protein